MTYQKWRRRLARANDPRLIPIEYIDGLVVDGSAQFWATDEAAMVTVLKDWPGGAVTVDVIAAAGKKGDITGPLREAAETWAREHATFALITGRDGWRKELPEYRHYQTWLIKEL